MSNRIPCAILGATGMVGQRFVQLLADHPWFEPVRLCASERKAGAPYGQVVDWSPGAPLPAELGSLQVETCDPGKAELPLVFSALSSDVAGPIEEQWARAGALVVSNASSHRMDADVPLIVPEINSEHLALLEVQRDSRGFGARGGIVTNPNCSTIGLALALAPLASLGIEKVHVVTMQALSGAGAGGPVGLAMVDNLLPYIAGEEEKLGIEARKIFGELHAGEIEDADLVVSAQCNRVPVIDGHTGCVSLRLEDRVRSDDLILRWSSYRSLPQELELPSAPLHPTLYLSDADAPQPRLHRDLERGMATSIGRLAHCPVLGWRFVFLSHNTLRGAAGGSILVAEMAKAQGWLVV